jgi:hypothetical protein
MREAPANACRPFLHRDRLVPSPDYTHEIAFRVITDLGLRLKSTLKRVSDNPRQMDIRGRYNDFGIPIKYRHDPGERMFFAFARPWQFWMR